MFKSCWGKLQDDKSQKTAGGRGGYFPNCSNSARSPIRRARGPRALPLPPSLEILREALLLLKRFHLPLWSFSMAAVTKMTTFKVRSLTNETTNYGGLWRDGEWTQNWVICLFFFFKVQELCSKSRHSKLHCVCHGHWIISESLSFFPEYFLQVVYGAASQALQMRVTCREENSPWAASGGNLFLPTLARVF